MDISNWPIDKVMQLPNHFFGRRWWIGTSFKLAASETGYFFSEEMLPERCVIWQLLAQNNSFTLTSINAMDFRLGSRRADPASYWFTLEQAIPGIGYPAAFYPFLVSPYKHVYLVNLRRFVHGTGHRLIIRTRNTTTGDNWYSAAIQVSGVPKEIPDELLHPPLAPTENYLKQIWQRIKL